MTPEEITGTTRQVPPHETVIPFQFDELPTHTKDIGEIDWADHNYVSTLTLTTSGRLGIDHWIFTAGALLPGVLYVIHALGEAIWVTPFGSDTPVARVTRHG